MTEIVKIENCQITKTGLKFSEKLSFDQWQEVGKQLQKIHGSIQWWIGDWLNFGEKKYGETYTQAIEETGLDYDTLTSYKWVAGAFESCPRGQNLSWSAHREIASAPEDKRVELLEKANEEKLTSREVKELVKEIKKLPTPALPKGKYQVIYADPPWFYGQEQHSHEKQETVLETHYPSMPTEDICKLPIKELGADNSVLFIWTTSPKLFETQQVIEAWGFEYKTSMVWDKVKHNVGYYVSVRHEFLLIATRGSCLPDNPKLYDSVLTQERTEHSKKPEVFYEIIEDLYKGKKIELFSRKSRKGWECWGNQL